MRLNPILLLDDLLCTAANGGRGVRIGWLADSATAGVQLLQAHGVRSWGYDMARNPDRRYCLVRPAQAAWAVGLLKGAGFGVVAGPDAPAVAPRSSWGVPAPGVGLGGLVASLLGVSVRAARRREARSTRRQRARR